MENGKVLHLSKSETHTFHKYSCEKITLIEGLGVEEDAHFGKTVKHRSRVAKDPSQPNLRQVHLIHSELFDDLREQGFVVKSGEMGENITTVGVDLLALPQGTILKIGTAEIKVTGLRNPCHQLNLFQDGLMNAVLDRDEDNQLIRKAGIMGTVHVSGEIKQGDEIKIELPNQPFVALERV